MKTFFVQTLGCRVNHYESDQIAELLRSRGLTAAGADVADLRVINTCSVTTQAASQSRQSVRRMHKLPVLSQSNETGYGDSESSVAQASGLCLFIHRMRLSDRRFQKRVRRSASGSANAQTAGSGTAVTDTLSRSTAPVASAPWK